MKGYIYFIVLLFGLSGFLSAESGADRVIGKWYTKNNKSIVKIYQKKNGKFYGKIVWLKNPKNDKGEPKKDIHNENKKLQDREVKGLQILKGFSYDKDDKKWEKGTIYNPEDGKTYACTMWFKSQDTLIVRGHVKYLSFLGKSQTWKRAKKDK